MKELGNERMAPTLFLSYPHAMIPAQPLRQAPTTSPSGAAWCDGSSHCSGCQLPAMSARRYPGSATRLCAHNSPAQMRWRVSGCNAERGRQLPSVPRSKLYRCQTEMPVSTQNRGSITIHCTSKGGERQRIGFIRFPGSIDELRVPGSTRFILPKTLLYQWFASFPTISCPTSGGDSWKCAVNSRDSAIFGMILRTTVSWSAVD